MNRQGLMGLLGTIVLVVLLIGLYIFVNFEHQVGPEFALPVLAIVGVLAMLVALGLLAMALSVFKLSDASQALGLPEGSVRAVIALALVLLFAILSIFLYSDLASGGQTTVGNLTVTQKDRMVNTLPPSQLLSVTTPAPVANGTPSPTGYTVSYRASNPASEDFAKQVLILIGTLVTAVASFYFGAKTATSAQSSIVDAITGGTAAKPVVRTVLPAQVTPNALPQPLIISGSGLNGVAAVKVAKGSTSVSATDVSSSDSSVKCNVVISAGSGLTDKCDIVLLDGSNKELLTAPGVVTVS